VPLRNLERGAFAHQIEEWYGRLPSGLPATFLADDRGVRQNNAPADAAGFRDNSPLNESNDGRIHVNLACLRCHAGKVLLPINDYARKVFREPRALGIPAEPGKEDLARARTLQLQRQYLSALERPFRRDQEDYQDALTRATVTPDFPQGLLPQKAVEVYARSYHAYADDPVTRARAAAELGTTEVEWSAALAWGLREVKTLDVRLVPLEGKDPLPLHRLTWEDVYAEAQKLLAAYRVRRRLAP
jgi:hypothetical protein